MAHLERHGTLPRRLQITAALGAFVWAWFLVCRKAPERLRSTLDQPGTTFVKLDQGLSLRRNVLPPGPSRSDATRRLAQCSARTANALPAIVADMLRLAQSEDGGPSLSIHHRVLEELELRIRCTGNRLSALVTPARYIAGSLLVLQSAGLRVRGHVPVFALVAYAPASLLSLRLVRAFNGSVRL